MIYLRFFYIVYLALYCAVLCCAADNPPSAAQPEILSEMPENRFEALCADGETQAGNILAMNSEKLILSKDGKTQTIPLERLELLQNCGENPYLTLISEQRKTDISNLQIQRRNTRPRRSPMHNETILPALITKPATVSKPKIIYPDSVIVLTLQDGSRIAAEKITMKGQTVQCVPLSISKNAAEMQFPVQQLAAVRFDVKSPDAVYAPPKQWTKIADAENSKSDKLIFGQNGTLDFYEGVITEITADKVIFVSDGETLPVPLKRVAGLVLLNNSSDNNNRRSPKGSSNSSGEVFAHLSLWNGTEIALKSITFRDSGLFDWTSASGISGTVSGSEIDRFEFGFNNFLMLSDLELVSVHYSLPFNWKNGGSNPAAVLLQSLVNSRFLQPEPEQYSALTEIFTSTALPFNDARAAKNNNNPLSGLDSVQLEGTVYQNGLSIPTGTVLEYRITDNFAALRGVAGVDDRLRPYGNVRLVIQANEMLLCDWIIRGYEPAKQLRFDLPKETKTLKITVEDISGAAGIAVNPFAVGIGNLKLIK